MLERLRRTFGTFVLDAEGRMVFRPWSTSAGYVLPDVARAADLWRRITRWGLAWFAAIFVMSLFSGFRVWTGWLRPETFMVAAIIAHYAWCVRRWTRGLERVRYEPPPA